MRLEFILMLYLTGVALFSLPSLFGSEGWFLVALTWPLSIPLMLLFLLIAGLLFVLGWLRWGRGGKVPSPLDVDYHLQNGRVHFTAEGGFYWESTQEIPNDPSDP